MGTLCGVTPIWCSEIEKFPSQVTAKNFPNMKNYGDVKKIHGDEIEPVDIITAGSPCQDLSVAGKRDGLDGTRSSLFLDAIRIIKEMRERTNGNYPKYFIWENVPGAFSSNNGDDFHTVLKEIAGIKGSYDSIPRPKKWSRSGLVMAERFSIAWRTLNAEYWGVPQIRNRIFLVTDFRGGGVQEKYYLSAKACQGILRRAETRGKDLPPILKEALIRQSSVSKETA